MRFFPFEIAVLDDEPFDSCACGIDWGIRSPAAAVLVRRLVSGVYYAVSEVYESEVDAVSFALKVLRMLDFERASGCPVWIDASTFHRVDGLVCVADRFRLVGLDVLAATRDRFSSMKALSSLSSRGLLVVSPACPHLISELRRYRGLDRDDHAMDAFRYAVYSMEVRSSCGVG